MLKNDGCDVASDDSAFPYAPNAGAPGALFPPLFPPSAIPSAPFASSPPPISSSTPLFSYSHRQRFPLDKTPKDERLLSADAATFDGPSQFQLGVNGSAVAFPSAQFATTAQRPNLCHQRSAQSAVAAQMAHAMAQQLVSSVYVPNLSSSSSSSSSAPRLPDTVRNSQHQPQQQKQSFDCPVVVPTHSHQQQQQQQQYPFVPNCAVPSAVFVPFCAAGTVPHCANSASTSSQQLYEPNFVPSLSVPAPAPLASRAGASSPSSSGGPSSASSLSGAYSSSASANCGAMPSGAAAAAMFFPQLYSVNNSGNDFYAYYAQQHNHHHHSSLVSQCHHQHPFLHHLGGAVAAAAATVPQPQPPVLLASNGCSAASSASNCSELEHGGASAAHQLASGVGASWRGTTTTNEEERRTKLMATIGGVAAGAAASRRAESGTFPGLCPQPRHPVGPGTNNVRVRTKDTYRVVYSECQRQELEQEFDNGGTFITRERKAALSARLRLTERQIKIWFQNRRAKERRRNGRKGQNPTVDF